MRPRLPALFAVIAAHGCFYNPKGSTGDLTGSTTESTTSSVIPTTTATTDSDPACGDGSLDPDEQCDDGNATPGDGCEVDCTKTPGENCGNGVVDDGEDCDDGNDGNTDPAGTEECDDGAPTASCDGDCTAVECGDGVVNAEAGEGCCRRSATTATSSTATVARPTAPSRPPPFAATARSTRARSATTATTTPPMLAPTLAPTPSAATAYDGCTTQCQLGPRCGDSEIQAPDEECDDGTPAGDDLCNACNNFPFRYVFVTSKTYTGDLNKLSGANIKCAAAADGGDILSDGSTWIAWLSDDAGSPALGMDTFFDGWYVLPGAQLVLVARGWEGLTAGSLQNPLDRDEYGAPVSADAMAWTNTGIDGKIRAADTPSHCDLWDSNTGTGSVGDPSATDATWTNAGALSDCNSSHHLYCVQN